MDGQDKLLIFSLSELRCALDITEVERVIRAVEITPVPKAPPIVRGVINIAGRVIPVLNIRKRFGLPDRALSLSDSFIIADTSRRSIVLIADGVSGVIEYSKEAVVKPGDIVPRLDYVEGVVKLDDGMVLIHDLDMFLSLEEEQLLDQALS
jgi:purine-binding chemotaxis protein CheW